MFIPKREDVQKLKNRYQKGQRIKLISMNDDLHPLPQGSEGSVRYVDDMGQIHMNWDSGSQLALVPDVDEFKITEINLKQILAKKTLPKGQILAQINETNVNHLAIVMGYDDTRDDFSTWIYNATSDSFEHGHYNLCFEEALKDMAERVQHLEDGV